MAVTAISMARTLSSVFGIQFKCEGVGGSFVVSAEGMDGSDGFIVETTTPFVDVCRASIQFGAFSSSLLYKWFESPSEIEKAFLFATGVDDHLNLNIKIAGQRVYTATEFIEAENSAWRQHGVSIELVAREFPQERADYYLYLTVVAIIGFAMYATGFVVDDEPIGEIEGERKVVRASKYERSPINRARCISFYGAKCSVCGFDFGEKYGPLAAGFIEVHHIVRLSDMDTPKKVDPIRDLVPLCSNCHSAIHLTTPPLLPEELKALIVGDE